jgi:hypothetical protein
VTDLDEAFRMLDTFASVGADSFVVTKTDINRKVKWDRTYFDWQLREKLPAMVRTAAIRRAAMLEDGHPIVAGENLIIRPLASPVRLIQLDDLKAEHLDRVRPAAFIIHATSPTGCWKSARGFRSACVSGTRGYALITAQNAAAAAARGQRKGRG